MKWGVPNRAHVAGVGAAIYLSYLKYTDYEGGKYDLFGPYPRKPNGLIADDVQRIYEASVYENRRSVLMVQLPEFNPLATPDPIQTTPPYPPKKLYPHPKRWFDYSQKVED